MATVFWNSEGVLMIDYLEWEKTVTGVYYADQIRKLCAAIKQKHRGKLRHGGFFVMTTRLPTRLLLSWLRQGWWTVLPSFTLGNWVKPG